MAAREFVAFRNIFLYLKARLGNTGCVSQRQRVGVAYVNSSANLDFSLFFVVQFQAFFGDPDAIRAHFSKFLQELREAPKAEGQTRIYTHGEKEVEAIADRRANGIPVNDNTMVEVLELCEYLNMDFSKYFGDYLPPKKGENVKASY